MAFQTKVYTISALDAKCLEHDLLSIDAWIEAAIAGKIAACKKRLIRKWTERFANDPTSGAIPLQERAFLNVVFHHPDYQTRTQRDAQEN